MKLGVDTVSQARDAASSKFSLMKSHAFNTDTFNALSQIPKHVRQAVIADGEILCNAPQWCEDIWKTMRKNDFATKGALNLPLVENIYKSHVKKFEKMLNIHSADELFEIMDADEDGSINEDEQILLFSVIKERMLKLSEDLCNLQEYPVYRDLMKAVRKIEQQIAKYQEVLRSKIYKSELKIYANIGEAKFDEFYEYYENQFKDLNTYSLDRTAQMQAQHEDQMNQLLDKLDRAVEAVKFKPKPQLKEYQTQEKLVSIDERVEEAMNFRKELKDLEVSEAQRINRLRIANAKKQTLVLQNEQAKELKHLQSKLLNEENKLIIRMKRDYDILKKKTHLHENEITKIQGLAAKYAMAKALEDGELQRMKNKSKKMNDIFVTGSAGSPTNGVTQLQGVSFGKRSFGQSSATINSSDLTNRTNIDFVKSMVKSPNVIKFHLKKSYGEEPPVNVKPVNYANEDKLSHKKVEIYLKQKTEKKDEIPNLTSLYDDNLQPIVHNENEKRVKLTNEEKLRTRQFINEKLNGDRKVAV